MEYTAKRARTRGQILGAGQEMLPGALRRGLDHALGPGPVTQRAALSRQTWYRYWRADDTGFLDELTTTALASVRLLLEPMLRPEPASTGVRAAARTHLALVTQPRVALVQTLIATLAIEDQLLEAEAGTRPTAATSILAEHYVRLHAILVGLYGPAIAASGRRLRPEIGLDDLIGRLAAFADGFALRHTADPGRAGPEQFAEVVETAVLAATEPDVTTN